MQYNQKNLLNAARTTTRLSDFGSDDFLEPLDLLLEDYHQSANLNAFGVMGAWIYLHRMLCNRLRLNKFHQQHHLDAEQIKAPLFILGLPRTGSTLLHELLANHPDLRAPLFWEATFVPGKNAVDKARQWVTSAQINIVDRLTPEFRSVHSLGTFLPHECITLQALSLRSMQFHAAHHLPRYNQWLNHCDWQPAYDYHRRYLAWLQHNETSRRWVLKAPGHLLSIKALLATYPDAKIIQLHRDPVEVIPSMASLFAALRVPFSKQADMTEIGRDVTTQWQSGLTKTMAFRDQNPDIAANIMDVHYQDLVQQPMTVADRILAFANLQKSGAIEQKFQQYLAANPKGKHGSHTYSLAKFGLNEASLQSQFADYNARYLNPANT